MEAKQFIIRELESLTKMFPKIKVTYGYDALSNVHFIEVLPRIMHEEDEGLSNWESGMFDKFVDRFPDENIAFISDDAEISIDNVAFVKEGLEYAGFTTYSPYPYDERFIYSDISVSQKVASKTHPFTVGECCQTSLDDTEIPNDYISMNYPQAA